MPIILHDSEFRRAILYALNRGEQYNGLYRGISILNDGAFAGLWSTWQKETNIIFSFTIITKPAEGVIKPIHPSPHAIRSKQGTL